MTAGYAPIQRRPVVLLSYSEDQGGGVERYVATVQSALGHDVVRINLRARGDSRIMAYLRLWRRLRKDLTTRDLVVVSYLTLLPLVLLTPCRPRFISVVVHGNEIWAPGLARRLVRGMLRWSGVRTVAVSGFSAGALFPLASAGVLPPGFAPQWFTKLAEAGTARRPASPSFTIVSSFRLNAWEEKGLAQLIQAVDSLGRDDIVLKICGSGEVSSELRDLVESHPFCRLLPNLPDAELAQQLAAADLFVLATRLRVRPDRSGEGFGMVLAEAQIAGTPVIAPAYGGCSDAYRYGITGLCPEDESAPALAAVIRSIVDDPHLLAWMSQNAARWAQEEFDPARYAQRAWNALLPIGARPSSRSSELPNEVRV